MASRQVYVTCIPRGRSIGSVRRKLEPDGESLEATVFINEELVRREVFFRAGPTLNGLCKATKLTYRIQYGNGQILCGRRVVPVLRQGAI